jgi:hypothetical protein
MDLRPKDQSDDKGEEQPGSRLSLHRRENRTGEDARHGEGAQERTYKKLIKKHRRAEAKGGEIRITKPKEAALSGHAARERYEDESLNLDFQEARKLHLGTKPRGEEAETPHTEELRSKNVETPNMFMETEGAAGDYKPMEGQWPAPCRKLELDTAAFSKAFRYFKNNGKTPPCSRRRSAKRIPRSCKSGWALCA